MRSTPNIARAKRQAQDIRDGRAANQLLALFDLGTWIQEICPQRSSYGQNEFRKLAKQIGVTQQTAYRTREFATRFDRQEVATLSKKAPNFTLGHVYVLCGVESLRSRQSFANQAITQGWTVHELRMAVQAKLGIRRGGGRPPKTRGPQLALAELGYRIKALKRFLGQHAPILSSRQADCRKLLRELARDLELFSKSIKS